jgi:hypothetical protein
MQDVLKIRERIDRYDNKTIFTKCLVKLQRHSVDPTEIRTMKFSTRNDRQEKNKYAMHAFEIFRQLFCLLKPAIPVP